VKTQGMVFKIKSRTWSITVLAGSHHTLARRLLVALRGRRLRRDAVAVGCHKTFAVVVCYAHAN